MTEKPRKACPYCPETFTDGSNRRRHIKRRHYDRIGTSVGEVSAERKESATANDAESVTRRMMARQVKPGDTIMWFGYTREILKVRVLTEDKIRVWFTASMRCDIPANAPMQRIDK